MFFFRIPVKTFQIQAIFFQLDMAQLRVCGGAPCCVGVGGWGKTARLCVWIGTPTLDCFLR